MVFGYFRDAWNYYFGNRYPGPSLVLALKERSDQTRSTAVVPYREDLRIIRQPTLRILRPIEEDEKESPYTFSSPETTNVGMRRGNLLIPVLLTSCQKGPQ